VACRCTRSESVGIASPAIPLPLFLDSGRNSLALDYTVSVFGMKPPTGIHQGLERGQMDSAMRGEIKIADGYLPSGELAEVDMRIYRLYRLRSNHRRLPAGVLSSLPNGGLNSDFLEMTSPNMNQRRVLFAKIGITDKYTSTRTHLAWLLSN